MENKFGMFIHWGFYSLLGIQEQVLARNHMDHAEYEQYMHQFNPTQYDPEEWVLLAKRAGMKYICFTAKHHDGFCMWDTKYTDYNIMNTPYHKDVLKMLADACHKHGMLLSIYYSNPDWNHKNAFNPLSTHQWKCKSYADSDPEKYRAFVKNQITELLTGYGNIYTFFWDIPPRYEDPSINELVRRLQPEILINNRGYDAGDFSTPERSVPDGSRFEHMTEMCESVGEQSWGYRKHEDYFSLRYLMFSIDKIMAMGGSYLLNVGPMPNGQIDPVQQKIIESVGRWYNKMEGTLEDTLPDPFPYSFKTVHPVISLKKNGKTYLHFYQGLRSSCVTLSSFPCVPCRVRLMNNGEYLPVEHVTLPTYVGSNGEALGPYVHITDIPVDDYPLEPIVLEIQWC